MGTRLGSMAKGAAKRAGSGTVVWESRRLLSEGKTVSGTLREHELDFLFGAEQRKQIGSTAVIALSHQGLHGVLAIASRDPAHYKSSVGTLFLTYIAEVLGRVLPRHTTTLRAVR